MNKITPESFKLTIKSFQDAGLEGLKLKTALESYLKTNEIYDGETKITPDFDFIKVEQAADNPAIDTKALTGAVSKAISDTIGDALTKGFADRKLPFTVEMREREEDNPDVGKWGFKNIGEYALSVYVDAYQRMGRPLPLDGLQIDTKSLFEAHRKGWGLTKTKALTAANESYGQDGGNLVPVDFREMIWTAVNYKDSYMGMCDTSPTNRNIVEIPADETTPWGSAGITASWSGEEQSTTAKKPVILPKMCRLNELRVFVRATNEVLQDTALLNKNITEKAPMAIRYTLNQGIFRGTGAGQLLGFLNPSYGGLVKQDPAMTAQIALADITGMVSKLWRDDGARGEFWYHPTALPQLAALQTSNGFPLFLPGRPGTLAGGAAEYIPDTLMGLPIRESIICGTLGSDNALILTNLKRGYGCFYKTGGIDFQSSIHLYFDINETAFRWVMRVGGQPYLSAPITLPDGATKQSHFITLSGTHT